MGLVLCQYAIIIILDIICFEHLIFAFDKLVTWTGTGKADKIKPRNMGV